MRHTWSVWHGDSPGWSILATVKRLGQLVRVQKFSDQFRERSKSRSTDQLKRTSCHQCRRENRLYPCIPGTPTLYAMQVINNFRTNPMPSLRSLDLPTFIGQKIRKPLQWFLRPSLSSVRVPNAESSRARRATHSYTARYFIPSNKCGVMF